MPKIAWIADFSDKEHQGGAQQTNRSMIEEGKRRGFEIEEVYFSHWVPPQDADLYILNNIRLIYGNYPRDLEEIIRSKKFVRYEHDYLWRFMPEAKMEELFKRSLLNIFLSPRHLGEHLKRGFALGEVHLQPSPIDTRFFNRRGRKVEVGTALYAGDIAPHKGIENILQYARKHPQLSFTLAGWVGVDSRGLLENLPVNCRFIGAVPFAEMPDFYRRFEYFIHLPNWVEPFGRLVMEAYMCGCKPIVNDNVGCLSYDWNYDDFEEVKARLKAAPRLFWDKIEELLARGLQREVAVFAVPPSRDFANTLRGFSQKDWEKLYGFLDGGGTFWRGESEAWVGIHEAREHTKLPYPSVTFCADFAEENSYLKKLRAELAKLLEVKIEPHDFCFRKLLGEGPSFEVYHLFSLGRGPAHQLAKTIVKVLLVRLRGRKIFWHIPPSYLTNPFRSRFVHWWRKIMASLVDAVVFDSCFVKETSRKDFVQAAQTVHTIPAGEFLDGEPDLTPPRRYQVGFHGIGRGDFVFLFFGEVGEGNLSLNLLFNAFAKIHHQNPRAKLLLAAQPVNLSRHKVDHLPIPPGTTAFFRPLSEREIGSLFRRADAVILPRFDELASGVVLLASKFGVPVILPKTSCSLEFFNSGRLFKPGSEGSLVEVMRGALKRRGEVSSSKFFARYRRIHGRSAQEVARDFLSLYQLKGTRLVPLAPLLSFFLLLFPAGLIWGWRRTRALAKRFKSSRFFQLLQAHLQLRKNWG